jgi:hypothetical protein
MNLFYDILRDMFRGLIIISGVIFLGSLFLAAGSESKEPDDTEE